MWALVKLLFETRRFPWACSTFVTHGLGISQAALTRAPPNTNPTFGWYIEFWNSLLNHHVATEEISGINANWWSQCQTSASSVSNIPFLLGCIDFLLICYAWRNAQLCTYILHEEDQFLNKMLFLIKKHAHVLNRFECYMGCKNSEK
jgi:hypothetical protein